MLEGYYFLCGLTFVLIIFQLYSDVVPKTCENFRYLCTGEKGESFHEDEGMTYKLSFKNSLFHRIVKNGWVQGGGEWPQLHN